MNTTLGSGSDVGLPSRS